MDGLGITFARAWAAKAKASRPQQTLPPQPVPSPQPAALHEPAPSYTPRSRSTTLSSTSSDSYMEKRLFEFQEWKQKITKDWKSGKSSSKEEPLPATEPHGVQNAPPDLSQQPLSAAETNGVKNDPSNLRKQSPTQQLTPQQSTPQQSTPQQSTPPQSPSLQSPPQQTPPQKSPPQKSPPQKSPLRQSGSQQTLPQKSPSQQSLPQTPPQQPQRQEGPSSVQPRSPTNKTPPAVREKARILALRARALPKPDLRSHPAFRFQHVRVRRKTHATQTNLLKCWRPTCECPDDRLWGCCEQMDVDSICEDCGYVLCTACGSRCRGEEWCVIQGCIRCQTKLGVNICTPHLRELRAKPTERFHGHLVEPSALFLVEKL